MMTGGKYYSIIMIILIHLLEIISPTLRIANLRHSNPQPSKILTRLIKYKLDIQAIIIKDNSLRFNGTLHASNSRLPKNGFSFLRKRRM